MSIDIDKLKALALVAKVSVFRPSIQAQAKDYFALVHALDADTVLELIAEVERLRAATQPAPIPSQTAGRLIPDAECAQSKCAFTTSGCLGECNIKRNPIMYTTSANIAAVYVVAAQPAPIPAQTEHQDECNSALRGDK